MITHPIRQLSARSARLGGRCRAFTLAEALIATVVLAFAVIGISETLTTSYQQTSILQQNTAAVALGRQVMEQVAAVPFTSLASYDGATGNTSTLQSTDGTTVFPSNSDVYSWGVVVEFRSTPSGGVSPTGDFALITVTLTPATGPAIVLSRLASRATWAT